MFNLWKQLDRKNQTVQVLLGTVGILVLLNFLLFWGWHSAPKRLTVYLPPDLTQSNNVVRPGDVPKGVVYEFAFNIFSIINTWSFDGTKDYKKAIVDYRYYLTTPFYNALTRDFDARSKNGALSRTRMVSGYSDMGFENSSVTVLGPNTWEVMLNLHVVERVGNSIVKDVVIAYPLRVVKVHVANAMNPFQLALDGFVSPPKRLKTLV